MKESKFWIWFIPLLIIISIGTYLLIDSASNKGYNSNNNSKTNEETKQKAVSDDFSDLKNSVFLYADKDKVDKIFNGEDAIIYLGSKSDELTKKSIVVLNKVVISTSIENVYYIELDDITDEFKNYLLEKFEIEKLLPSTVVTVQDSKVLDIYTDDEYEEDLIEGDSDDLFEVYQDLVDVFIEACDSDC